MPFVIPTLPALIDRIKGDINARMGNANALVARSLPWVLAHVNAGAFWSLYLYQAWAFRQVFPDTAEAPYFWRFAQRYGIVPEPASKAEGPVTVTGAAGAELLDGSLLEFPATGKRYQVVGDYTWAGSGNKTVTVRALEAGAAGDLAYAADAILELVTTPAGLVSTCPVQSAGISGGLDEEGAASGLVRLLERLRNPPQGGAVADYVAWARTTDGVPVDGVWVENWFQDPALDLGHLWIRFTVKEGQGYLGSMIPTTGQILAVQARIDAVKPATAVPEVAVLGDYSTSLALDASLVDGFSAADAKAAIVTELRAVYRENAAVASGYWRIANSKIQEAVARVSGITSFRITSVNGEATGDADLEVDPYYYPTVVAGGITLVEV